MPSSKSFVHRQLIAAALAQGETVIRFRGISKDIEASAGCIRALGGGCEYLPADACGEETLRVSPISAPVPGALLDCGESGSTARFFLPVAAAVYTALTGTAELSLTGSGRLPGRPMADLCGALRAHGCAVSADSLPLSVTGTLAGGEYTLPGNVSSQYITGLQLALPLLKEASTLQLTTAAVSVGYLDITAAVLVQFGVTVEKYEQNGLCGWRIPGGQRYTSPGTVAAEGDWSNAAFWLCADAILRGCGGAGVAVRGLNPASVQGDRAVLQAIAAITAPGDTVLDVDAIPDLVPVLAVLAAAQQKNTTFANAARLRIKESDRLDTVTTQLNLLGADLMQGADFLTIRGVAKLHGGAVSGCNDHRIAMMLAMAATRSDGEVLIDGAECVSKSYPNFWEDYVALGGQVERID